MKQNDRTRKTERLDYAVLHNTGIKRVKQESVSEEVFRSVSSELDNSFDDSASETISNTSIDYSVVDEPFNNKLNNLSVQFEGIEVESVKMAEATRLRNLEEAISMR